MFNYIYIKRKLYVTVLTEDWFACQGSKETENDYIDYYK